MKIILFANTDWYLYNFRKSLILALREYGYDVILISPAGCYGEEFLNMGFKWIAAPMDRRSLNPLKEIYLVFWLYQLMKQEKVDLIHGFTIKCAVYSSIAAHLAGVGARVCAVAGMGYVFTSQDLKARFLRPFVSLIFIIAFLGKRTRLILQNPDDVAVFVRARLIPSNRIRLIKGSGVDCVRFMPSHLTGDDSDIKFVQVLLPARLLRDKGIAEYIEASRILKAEGHHIKFMLAGDPDPGNPASIQTSEVEAWAKQGLVEWLGHVGAMDKLFNDVDIVALPSYREGLPKGLIEAAASGKALITTDVPGCREVVENDVDGLLVPVKDSKSLALAIKRLATDKTLRDRLGIAAREKALNQFDEKIIISKTIEVYKEILC